MKTYADVLINTFEGGHKWYKADPDMSQMHYEAHHKTEPIFIMWMEAKLLNRRCTLPCVLWEEGDALVFKSSEKFSRGDQNASLMKRWSLFVTTENIHTEFEVRELTPQEFKAKYKQAQSGELFEEDVEVDMTEVEDMETDIEDEITGENESK